MSQYVFAPQARQDLLEIWGYIALENQQPGAANRAMGSGAMGSELE